MQWLTVFNRESLEAWRNFKWIWVPLVFILLGLMDPLTTYYMPQILDAVGGLPEGAIIDIPSPPAVDVLMMSIGQFNMLGVAIIVLISMGTIAGERKSGVAELILVKPIRYSTYVTAKWMNYSLICVTAVSAGMLSSWYYVSLLFEEIPFGHVLTAAAFYSLWIIFIVTVNIMMNTLVKVPGVVAFLTIAFLIALQIIGQIFQYAANWIPSLITSYIGEVLTTGNIPEELWWTSLVTVGLIITLLVIASYTLKNKEVV
ncbi:putative transmembrane protein YxlG [Halobacillus andaensis]|uniref:Transmembrane protein YxlG n=1 Tax=Halobacillus andaensis TaxID=1176239 RepID=A0A917B605_HALAA|nr:ABC transporter permease subunit [Halobacillus andaensis]MBP2006001.1 ABC-2 type transport system permease protein [Halobacillus andaensis]GGF24390.1 putative transmembrane protein YxlG [Halobacillus andaensis]